ncbi:MAG: cellulose binding domain-containing protein [Polyangiaceae bacterium]
MMKARRISTLATLALAGLCACVHGIEPEGPGGDGGSAAVGPGGGGDASTVGSGGSGTATNSAAATGGSSVTAASSTAANGTATVASSSASGSPVMGVNIEYKADNTPSNNSINPHFRVANSGSSAVDLTNITIRYWYTKETGSMTQVFHCDWAKIDCGNLGGAFTAASGMNADHYLEVTFTGGSVAPGDNSGPIQLRFNMSDYAAFDETNDYSYDASKTAFAPWDKVTAYSGGQLIWGTEP